MSIEIPLFLQALSIGFAVAVPLGPLGLLCIERTLRLGLAAGLATGLGVALADASYGALVATGATIFAEALADHERATRILGGAALAAIGLRSLFCVAQTEKAVPVRSALLMAFVSAYLLTLANPATIASFAAIFAGLGLSRTAASPGDAAMVVTGVFLGSLVWWIVLSTSVTSLRHHLPASAVAWINRGAGAVLITAGLWLAGAAL